MKIEFEALGKTIETLKSVQQVDLLLGSLMTTQGTLLLFFSHRFNREHPVIVSGKDAPKVLQAVEKYL